jgi:gluconolactonase
LIDCFEGKRLNSPNDIICASDDSIWFTDPPFGISNDHEGDRSEPELPACVYRIDAGTGKAVVVTSDIKAPMASPSVPTKGRCTSSRDARPHGGFLLSK